MNAEQQQFVEDMGQLMAGWSIPRTTGRLYGYLLLQTRPTGLDEIAAELELAKSGVSVGLRQLLALGVARSLGQRGSRRLLYEPLYDLEAILAARNAQMLRLRDRLRQGAQVAQPGPARQRMEALATQMQEWMDVMYDYARRTHGQRQVS